MHSRRLPGLEGKAREESMIRNLGDPIGLKFFFKRTEIGKNITDDLA